MNLENQLLFFFSALGAFNGLFLSLYFAFFIKNRSRATYFLAGLLFVISVRVTKSVFLSFYADISNSFIQVGLTACMLIGPFLYLYITEVIKPKSKSNMMWLYHIIPVIVTMVALGYYYPYFENRDFWQRSQNGYFGWAIFLQWLTYIILTIYSLMPLFKQVVSRKEKIKGLDFWLISVVLGVAFIFLAYSTTGYTSYIVGALSFSFTFYLLIVIWVLRKKKKNPIFFDNTTKYANRKIDPYKVQDISNSLKYLFEEEEIHRNPNLKLSDLAHQLNIKTHELSQYLNEHLGMGFSNYINTYRIASAEKMLQSSHALTLQGIGIECGFKSNSTFYKAFKAIKGVTPAQFKKSL